MNIRIVGSGCATCKKLHERVQRLVKEHHIDADVQYSTDINELIDAGALGSPGIFKDGTLVSVGAPGDAELLALLT